MEEAKNIELNPLQRVTIITALRKELEGEEKQYRAEADAAILNLYKNTGAKTFEVALDNDERRIPIGTASVVTKEGGWTVTDFDAFADGASYANALETTLTIPPDMLDAVYDALKNAGLLASLPFKERPVDNWRDLTIETGFGLAWKETGEDVKGIEYTPGKTYTQLRPKSLNLVQSAARALYGQTPMGLLEGGSNA